MPLAQANACVLERRWVSTCLPRRARRRQVRHCVPLDRRAWWPKRRSSSPEVSGRIETKHRMPKWPTPLNEGGRSCYGS